MSFQTFASERTTDLDFSHEFINGDETIKFMVSPPDYILFRQKLEQFDDEEESGIIHEVISSNTIPFICLKKGYEKDTIFNICKIFRACIYNYFKCEQDKLDSMVIIPDKHSNYPIYMYVPGLKVETSYFSTTVLSTLIATVLDTLRLADFESKLLRTVYTTTYPINPEGIRYVMKGQDIIEDERSISSIFPSMCSILSNTVNVSTIAEIKKISAKDKKRITLAKRIQEEENIKKQSDMEIVNEIKHLISPERIEKEYHIIGQCIYNIFDGSQEGFDIWISLIEPYCQDSFQDIWKCYSPTNLGIGTFRYWCKNDNIDGYNSWKANNLGNLITKSISATAGDSDIVQVMKMLYGDVFVCASYDKKLWFIYKNNRYQKSDGGVHVEREIEKMVPLYERRLNTIIKQLAECTSEDDASKLEMMQKSCMDLIRLLKGKGKASLMREAAIEFYNEEFLEKMDSNFNLISFTNGVFDCLTGKIRSGSPQDYITMSTKYAFIEYTWTDDKVLECLRYLKMYFPDPIELEYILYIFAGFLHGGNLMKRIIHFYGNGNNAKSTVVSLLLQAYGEYACSPPNELITSQKVGDPHGHTAGDEVVRNKYVALFAELKDGSIVNDAKLKSMSNGDLEVRSSRALHVGFKEMRSSATPILMYNNPPKFNGADDAMVQRTVVINFRTKFLFPSDYNKMEGSVEEKTAKNIYLADENIGKRMLLLKDVFMWILVQYYKKYYLQNKHCDAPSTLSKAKEIYVKSNDIISCFLDDKYEVSKTTDVEELRKQGYQATLQDTYNEFIAWHKENHPGVPVPLRNVFLGLMKSKGLEQINMCFYGIKRKAA